MFNPAGMWTGRPPTDDLVSTTRTDTGTTMVPVIVGYSDSARGVRLRLRFDDRSCWWMSGPPASPLAVLKRMTS
jgi:hypothetical protein